MKASLTLGLLLEEDLVADTCCTLGLVVLPLVQKIKHMGTFT